MSRLGNLNGKALRVALCAVEMTGAAAEPIGDVQAIVDSRYDEVAYGGYTRAMMRDELEEEQRKGKCVAFHAVKVVHGATLFTGQAKALGGYNAETAQGERATAIHMEHAICSAIATGKKTAEMRFTAHGSTGIPNLRPGATSLVLVVPSAGNAPRRPAPTEQQRNSKKQRNSKGGTAQQQEIHEELFGTDTISSAVAQGSRPRSTCGHSQVPSA